MIRRKMEDFMENRIVNTVVYYDTINLPMLEFLTDNASKVYWYTTSKINPLPGRDNLIMRDVSDTVQDAVYFEKKNGKTKVDLYLFNVPQSKYDIKVQMNMWTANIRKGGLMLFNNTDFEMHTAIIDYAMDIDTQYYDVNYDQENEISSMEHR